MTKPLPCPYLDGLYERRLVAELSSVTHSRDLHETLSRVGFRRSHSMAYTPVCENCSACIAIRSVSNEFIPSSSQRRIIKANQQVVGIENDAKASIERFDLFSDYQQTRHPESDMATMDYNDFRALVEETCVPTLIIDFYDTHSEMLIAGCIVDVMDDGLSAVYSYFNPNMLSRSLGTFIILWLIDRADQIGLDYVYLGYWVAGSKKMEYKSKFQPLEYYGGTKGWQKFDKTKLIQR